MQPGWLKEGWPHVWLPYTQMETSPLPQPVVGAEGCELILADGRRLLDGISSWWSACHGYGHPHLRGAIQTQLEQLPHVMFGGLAHEPAYRLAKKLAEVTPGDLERVFFCDSGSVAVEVALKIATQYWRNKGKPGKSKFVCFRHGYHGDTLGAMSVSDPEQNLHSAFKHTLPHHYVIDIPSDEYAFAEFEALLEDMGRNIAGLIIEPLVQGAGGMKFHTPDVLAELHRICQAHEVLFIADEIAVGFGRTGYLFACEEAGIVPDILCLGKALTGGMISLAATLVRPFVFEAFLGEDFDKALMHGPTYMANPLASAAALASLELFEREPRLRQVEAIERQLRDELNPCVILPAVYDVRVKGAIGVVQLREGWMNRLALRERFIELGVWLRPLEDVVYIAPPLTISHAELRRLCEAVQQVVSEIVRPVTES